jgi:hypothetical protein
MDRRRVFGLLSAGAFGGARMLHAATSQGQENCAQSHDEWLEGLWKQMLAIKAGMTREMLLTVFKTEGGLSTAARRTYVFEQCPKFKVDVDFKPAEASRQQDDRTWLAEDDKDVIVKISAPYLAYSVMD